MLELFIKVVEKGLPITIEDYNHFRKMIDFPELAEEYENINININIKQNREENEGIEQREKKSKATTEKENTEEEANDVIKEEEEDYIKFSKNIKPNRKPNKYEARIDFVKEERLLQNL